MAQTEEHTVRGLTGSPRAEEGGGDSRAAPGDWQAVPLRSPSGSEVEGEWETGAETRDDPATAAPPPSHSASASPPRLIPPLSVDALPRPRPQVASDSAPGRPLPAVALRPRLPAPYPRARARAPCPFPSGVHGSARLCFPLCRPARLSAGSACFWASPLRAAFLGHLPLPARKALGSDSGE